MLFTTATMVLRDSTLWLETLSLKSSVLATFDDSKWELATIAKVGYKLGKKDAKLLKTKGIEVKVNDEVPYRIKLQSGALRPVLSVHTLREFSGENVVRCRADPSLLETLGLRSEEYHDIFLLAVKLRNLKAAKWMHDKVPSTTSIDGKELLTKAFHFEQASMVPSFENSENEVLAFTELSDLLDWISANYKVGYNDYEDNLQRTPEHVAALRGDLLLLRYALERGDPPNPLDIFQMSPFMYAARKGNVNVLGMYRQAVLDGMQVWQDEALTQANKQLQSCWDFAKNEQTKAVLVELLTRVELDSFQRKKTCWDVEIRDMDAAFHQMLNSNSSSSALEAAIHEAQSKSSAYVALCPRWRESSDFFKTELLVLGDVQAWQKKEHRYILTPFAFRNSVELVGWMQKRLSKTQCLNGLQAAAFCDSLETVELFVKHTYLTEEDLTQLANIAVSNWSLRTLQYFLQEFPVLLKSNVLTYMENICSEENPTVLEGILGLLQPVDPENCTKLITYLDSLIPALHRRDAHSSGLYRRCLDAAVRRIRMHPADNRRIPESLITWLVNEKKCDLLSSIEGSPEDYDKTPWFQCVFQKALDELTLKKTEIARQVQPRIRGFLTRKQVSRDMVDLGCWHELIAKIMKLKRKSSHETFGKTWAELKIEYNYVSQSSEFDIYEDEALGTQCCEDNHSMHDLTGTLEPLDEPLEQPADVLGGIPGEATVCNILLTSEVLKWLRSQKDQKYRQLFHKRIDQLARGLGSYCLSKRLKGSAHGALETKLDKGQRIVWTQREKDRMIWFVCKHDKISRCCELIDRSYDRVIRSDAFASIGDKGEEPEMLANPISNVPLKIHAVEVDDLARLLDDTDWTPPLHLTPTEQAIVSREGTVLLIGRSGTGKTLCVCNRMARDRSLHGRTLRQLFVSRTSRLCEYVEALQKKAGEDLSTVALKRVDDFVDDLSKDVDPDKRWLRKHYVTYERFCSDIWPTIQGSEKELDVLHVWTQIRSFIKGSYEATVQRRPLTMMQYTDLALFSKDRCRLKGDQRIRAYGIYEEYQRILEKNGWWDELDRACYVYSALHGRFAQEGFMKPIYDRIYVDEIQDITQSEITLLFLVTGNDCNAMFFAGDTAQTVSQGVDFRFEEIRQIVYEISNRRKKLDRPEKLWRNFRSHNGILSVSNLVLDRLHMAFPAAASKLPPDTGLVLGPRPGLVTMDYNEIAALIKKNSRLRILVRDEIKSSIQAKLGKASETSCLGIREAKGLEFRDVAVVDFFGTVANGIQNKAWKSILLGDTSKKMKTTAASLDIPIAMELELKLLYTAITRSCNRLFFIETTGSQSYDAWCRCLTDGNLAQHVKADAFGGEVFMTVDDWMIEGIEIASQVTDSSLEEAKNMLARAKVSFQKARDKDLEQKCEANLKAIELLADAEAFVQDSSSGEDRQSRRKAAETVGAYLDAGLVNEASRVSRRLCSNDTLGRYVVSEIQALRG